MKSLILAFQFLTVFPFPNRNITERDFGRSVMWFPVVGFVLGLLLYLFFLLFRFSLSSLILSFCLVLILAVLTRGLHLEGLGDFLDGFLVGKDNTDILRNTKLSIRLKSF